MLRLGQLDFNSGQRTSMLYFYDTTNNTRLSGCFTVVGKDLITTTMPFHYYEGKMPLSDITHKFEDSVLSLKNHGLYKSSRLATLLSLKRLQQNKSIRPDLTLDNYGDYGVIRVNQELCCFVPLIRINGSLIIRAEETTHPNGLTTTDILFKG